MLLSTIYGMSLSFECAVSQPPLNCVIFVCVCMCVYTKSVLMQHFRFYTHTDILVLVLINKFYSTDILKLANTLLLTDISEYYPQPASNFNY